MREGKGKEKEKDEQEKSNGRRRRREGRLGVIRKICIKGAGIVGQAH